MSSSTLTIRIDSKEKDMLSSYAKVYGLSSSEFARRSILEKIEDELDIKEWKASKEEFEADPETLSAEDIAKKYL